MRQPSEQLIIKLDHPLYGLKTLDNRDLKLHGEHLVFTSKPSPKNKMKDYINHSPSSIESPTVKMSRKYKDFRSNSDIRVAVHHTPFKEPTTTVTHSIAVGSDHDNINDTQLMDKTLNYLSEPAVLKRNMVKVVSTTRNSDVEVQASTFDQGLQLKSQFSQHPMPKPAERQASQSSMVDSQISDNGIPRKIKLLSVIAQKNQSTRINQQSANIILPLPSHYQTQMQIQGKSSQRSPIILKKNNVTSRIQEEPQNTMTNFRKRVENNLRNNLAQVQDRLSQNTDKILMQQHIVVRKPQVVVTAGGGFNLVQKTPQTQKDDIITGATTLIGVTPDNMTDTNRRDRSFESVVAQLSTKRRVKGQNVTLQAIDEVAKLAQVTRNLYHGKQTQQSQAGTADIQTPTITKQMLPGNYQAVPNSPHLKSINIEKVKTGGGNKQQQQQPVVKLPNIYNFDTMNFEYTEQNIQSITHQQSNNTRREISPNIPSIAIMNEALIPQAQEQPSRFISNHKSFLEAIEQQYMNQTRQKEVPPAANTSATKHKIVPISQITHFAPWNQTNQSFYSNSRKREKKTRSIQSHYSTIAEDLVMGVPDDMSKISSNGPIRINNTGFPQC